MNLASGKRVKRRSLKARQSRPRRKMSPSGRYQLVIETFTTGPNCWNCTLGTVFDQTTRSKGALVRQFKRGPGFKAG
jgi:hypothetical protein